MKEVCRIYRPRLALYAEGELGDRREALRVRRHLDACPDCREWLEAWNDDTVALLAQAGGAARGVDDGRLERLFGRLDAAPPPRREVGASSRWFSLAAALLVVAALLHVLRIDDPGTAGSPASPEELAISVGEPASESGSDSRREAGRRLDRAWRGSGPREWLWVPVHDWSGSRSAEWLRPSIDTLLVAVDDVDPRRFQTGGEGLDEEPVVRPELSAPGLRVALEASLGAVRPSALTPGRWYLVAEGAGRPGAGSSGAAIAWCELVPRGVARVTDAESHRARLRARSTGRAYRLVAVPAPGLDVGAWASEVESPAEPPPVWRQWSGQLRSRRPSAAAWSIPAFADTREF